MLHPLDDLPIHQTSEPLLHTAAPSLNSYDRYFFNGYDPDGEIFFACALGLYPNRRVIDGAFAVIRHGVQHNVRISGRCPVDRATTIGPLSVEIVEPMRRHTIRLAPETGIAAELSFTMTSPVVEEPRFVHRVDGRTVLDYTRLTQFGRWSGSITVDGDVIELDESVVGVRDRSWGVRPVGRRIEGPPSVPQFYWIWAPTIFDDACTHLAINHDATGNPWHQSGAAVGRVEATAEPLDPSRVQRSTTATANPTWQPGTRWIESITTNLEMFNAEPVTVSYEPLLRFQMSGLGYTHQEKGHGFWLGELEVSRDEINLSEVDPQDPQMIHVQTLARARWGERAGVGTVEQLVFGPHKPSGLTGIIDGA